MNEQTNSVNGAAAPQQAPQIAQQPQVPVAQEAVQQPTQNIEQAQAAPVAQVAVQADPATAPVQQTAPVATQPVQAPAQPAQVVAEQTAVQQVQVAQPTAVTQPVQEQTPVAQAVSQAAPATQAVQQVVQEAPIQQAVQVAVQPAPAVAEPVAQAPVQPTPVAQQVDIVPQPVLNPIQNVPVQEVAVQTTTPVVQAAPSITPNQPVSGALDSNNVGFVAASGDVKKKKNVPLRVLIALIIFTALALVGYFVVYPFVVKTFFTDPKKVYEVAIKNTFNEVNGMVDDIVYDKMIFDGQLSFETNMQGFDKFSGYTYGVNIGVDPENKKIQTGVTVKDQNNVGNSFTSYLKDGKEYLRYSTYKDLIYAGEANLQKESQLFASYQELLDLATNCNKEDLKYLNNKISDLLIGSIDETKLYVEDASIIANGSTIKVTNNKYEMNEDTRNKMLEFIITGIKNDDKTLEIVSKLLKHESKEKTTEYLDSLISEEENAKNSRYKILEFVVNKLKSDDKALEIISKLMNYEKKEDALKYFENLLVEAETRTNEIIYFNIYTTGLKNEFTGFNITTSLNDFSFHAYFVKYFVEYEYYSATKDSETNKESVVTYTLKGDTVSGKTQYDLNKKYINDEGKEVDDKVASFNVYDWTDQLKDVSYVVYDKAANISGNVKYSAKLNEDNAKYKLNFTMNRGKEYLKFDGDFSEDWTTEVAYINTGTAVTLTDAQIESIDKQFFNAFYATPIGLLYSTVSGDYTPGIENYYGNNN